MCKLLVKVKVYCEFDSHLVEKKSFSVLYLYLSKLILYYIYIYIDFLSIIFNNVKYISFYTCT